MSRPALADHFHRHAMDKETLDSMHVLQQLSRTGEFASCERYHKQVDAKRT